MASTGKLDVEVELKSEAEKFWHGIRDAATFFPKAFPDLYKSIDVLEGDGKSIGSIRHIHYAEGYHVVSSVKEKIEIVDEEKRTLSYSVIEGDLLKYYKNFKAHLMVTPKGEGKGSTVKYTCEFEKASEEIPDPHLIRDFAARNFQELDSFILGA
ncbi:hypothetical protein LguiB_016183 [Lonicera macranthoides]